MTARLLIILILFAYCNNVVGQHTSDTTNNSHEFVLLRYGLQKVWQQNAEHTVSDRWGIKYYTVAGCIVSKKIIDSVAMHNRIMEKKIASKYGKRWNKKFNKEVNLEYKKEKNRIRKEW